MLTIRLIEQQPSPVSGDVLRHALEAELSTHEPSIRHVAIELLITDDSEMQRLNREHRGVDKTTDVLSLPTTFDTDRGAVFPELPGVPRELGVIVISLDQATRQVGRFGDTLEDELVGLARHGLRHLLGHDHDDEGSWR
ncbi:MAG: rRNA maturation RNase YbeY [Patescibacteria group bacterium]|jgi:probable rRNA maturation factor